MFGEYRDSAKHFVCIDVSTGCRSWYSIEIANLMQSNRCQNNLRCEITFKSHLLLVWNRNVWSPGRLPKTKYKCAECQTDSQKDFGKNEYNHMHCTISVRLACVYVCVSVCNVYDRMCNCSLGLQRFYLPSASISYVNSICIRVCSVYIYIYDVCALCASRRQKKRWSHLP